MLIIKKLTKQYAPCPSASIMTLQKGIAISLEGRYLVLTLLASLGTTFQLELTILILWTKFAQKCCFQSKTEKVNTTIEFGIFELMYEPNFGLN